ncbi:MAG: hypothetical protein P0Y58_20160 [Candidatus Pseudomonas phytovorans]|uniref:Uncharacterized protein n=1 Tax=Candidatus Pseudomonas phytovorans TaxID=3121377 RepID=A0AAJ6BA06_9PSED|nr:hypothetical protein [Pseudomonas sp.]WEK29208.1 MAG: hypothetical protein P0Y58_20160 [Pseudomonas sp.]
MPIRRLLVAVVLGFRITAIAGFRLEPWHTYVPHEMARATSHPFLR